MVNTYLITFKHPDTQELIGEQLKSKTKRDSKIRDKIDGELIKKYGFGLLDLKEVRVSRVNS